MYLCPGEQRRLSWRLGLSGTADRMGPAFVEAVAGSLFVLAAFACLAIVASLMARQSGFTTLHKT